MIERFRSVPLTACPAVRGQSFVHDLLEDRIVRVSDAEITVLQRLSFATDHEALVGAGEDLHWSADVPLDAVLRSLRRKGLLMTDAECERILRERVLDEPTPRVDASVVSDSRAPIDTVAFPTADRPHAAARCVSAYCEYARRWGRPVRIVVCDDGRRTAASAALERIAARAGDPSVKVQVFDKHKASRFVMRLARRLELDPVDRGVLSFGLLGDGFGGPTYGAARNRILLLTAGERFVMCDDDTLAHFVVDEVRSDGAAQLGLSYRSEPADPCYFESLPQVWAETRSIDVDTFGVHDRHLGIRLDDLLSRYPEPLHLDECSRAFVYDLVKWPRTVVLTSCGTAGCSGYGSPARSLFVEHEARERLLASRKQYARLRLSPYIYRAARRATVTGVRWLMTTHVGVDNTAYLPPFPPHFRNEDGVWAALIRVIRQEALTLHADVAVPHIGPAAPFREEALSTYAYRLSDLLRLLAEEYGSSAVRMPPERLSRGLGRFLVDLGSLGDEEFSQYVRSRIVPSICGLLTRIHSLTYKHAWSPDYYLADVQRFFGAVRDEIESGRTVVPAELRSPGGTGISRTREYLRLYGRLVELWPDIVATARRENPGRT